MTHAELVARLATSNIVIEDFSYLATHLMEDRTCKNCTYHDPRDNYCSELMEYGMEYCSRFKETT